jgi:hypothetical protein
VVAAWAAAARVLRHGRIPRTFASAFASAVGTRALFWSLAIGCVAWRWS